MKFSFRNGTRTQAIDPILAAQFPELGAGFRQRGVATLVVEADWGADLDEYQLLWGSLGRPNPTLILRGVPVYDPRDPTQFLPADPDDPDELAAASRLNTLGLSVVGCHIFWDHREAVDC